MTHTSQTLDGILAPDPVPAHRLRRPDLRHLRRAHRRRRRRPPPKVITGQGVNMPASIGSS
jgi:hypothetical protein